MELVKPYALQPGDRIGIVAPSMHIIDENAVENGIAILEELGFAVELGPTVRSKYRNTTAVPEDRAGEIMHYFTDPATKAIVCLIGGDAASQILKLLDYETIRNNPKIFSGMSDIGHLNLAFLARAHMVSIYGPDLTFGFGANKDDPATRYNIDLFIKCCTRSEPLGKIPAFTQLEDYRHCSTHRRPIYIQTRTMTTSVTGTSGYFGTSETRVLVERNICTNPWDLKPRVRVGVRPVVGYCESLLQRIKQKLDTIINQLA